MGYKTLKDYLGLSDRALAGILKRAPGTVARYSRGTAPVEVEEYMRSLAEAKERLERAGFSVVRKLKPRGKFARRSTF